MENWQEEMLQAFLNNHEADETLMFQCVQNAAQALGFEYVSYWLRLPLPITKSKFVFLNNYPVEWQQLYESKDYASIDPLILQGQQSCTPIVWSDDVFRFAPEFWQQAQAQGLKYGWSQSTRGSCGLPGMLSLVRSAQPISQVELDAKEKQMQWLTSSAHILISRVLLTKFEKEYAPCLTPREIEILKWTADGKSADDIADILELSVNTVNFHVRNLILKFNVSNKTSAVVRALMFGVLY